MRCASCPVGVERTCFAEFVPVLCRHVANGRGDWVRWLQERAGQTPPPRSSNRRPVDAGPVRACILGPGMVVGGAERWSATLVRYADPARVRWVGIGCTDAARAHPMMVGELQSLCPVALGPAACRDLAARSEVVIVWGLPDITAYIPTGPDRPFLIASSHGDWRSEWTRVAMAAACPIADAVVAVSRASLGPIPEPYRDRAIIIPNGVDRRRLVSRLGRAAQRAAWGIPEGALVLGFTGRLYRDKDPWAIARAIACLPEPWVGVVVGDGLEMANVVAHAVATAPGRVIFAGATADVGSALGAFDVQLVPSPEEGFGLVYTEAWSAGMPVIGTLNGIAIDHPDLLRAIPEHADGPTLAAAVLADQADPEWTRERCRRARKVARERYSAECFAEQWSALLWRLARAEAPVASE